MRQVTSRSGNSRKFTRAPLAWILGVALSVASAPPLSRADESEAGPGPEQQQQVQIEAEPAAPPALIEEIHVTGSRISRKELEVAAPITIYTQADIKRSGVTNVGQLLRELPSVHGQADTTQVNNGGGGTMQISLRGLEAVRTLVLMNGRRLPPSVDEGADGTAVDLSTIPLQMIERVEVLKDGASAIYGSDAVAGVVNVITRDFDGFEVSAYYGDSTQGGGETQELSLLVGDSTANSRWTFYAQYADAEEVEVSDRSWAEVPLASFLGNVIFLGSSAPPWGRYRGITAPGFDCVDCTRGPEFGDFRTFDYFGGDSYNFAPANYQRVPAERWQFGLTAEYEIDAISQWGFLGEVTALLEASFTNREGQLKLAEVPLAPLAFFGVEAPYAPDNFHNPFGVEISDWRRRMVEGGSRLVEGDEDTTRIMLGLRGEYETGLLAGWEWELYYSRGKSERDAHFGPVYNLRRVANAVGPTTGSPETGDLACVADAASCVPLNVFEQDSVTQEMLIYIAFRTNERFEAEQDIYEFTLSQPELLRLPAGPVGFAMGYQYREDSGKDIPGLPSSRFGRCVDGDAATTDGRELRRQGMVRRGDRPDPPRCSVRSEPRAGAGRTQLRLQYVRPHHRSEVRPALASVLGSPRARNLLNGVPGAEYR